MRSDTEMLKREKAFSTFRNMNVLIVSWNVDASKPDTLIGSPDNLNFLSDVLKTVDSPDIISFGWQEVIDLESRKMAAKSVLMGKKKAADGGISEKVSSSYKRWHDRLVLAVRLAMPPDTPYTVIHTENLVGLFSCIFVKQKERVALRHVAVATVKRGMGGRYGNKVISCLFSRSAHRWLTFAVVGGFLGWNRRAHGHRRLVGVLHQLPFGRRTGARASAERRRCGNPRGKGRAPFDGGAGRGFGICWRRGWIHGARPRDRFCESTPVGPVPRC